MPCEILILHARVQVHGIRSIYCQTGSYIINTHVTVSNQASGFGGLEVACWPLVPNFAGSNPAEAVGFFTGRKSSARLPSEGK